MIFRRGNVPTIFGKELPNMRPFDLDLVRFLDTMASNLAALFDKGIGIDDNLDVQIVDYTTNAVANTQDTVAHTLKRVPEGYIVVSVDKAGVIYKSGAFTATDLLLKCNVATVVAKLIVF
jgi:hypothetical protein